jgi:hypothetical protein
MTIQHVRYFAESIGPRGSTTPKELEAAEYSTEVLRQAGLEAVIEPFKGAISSYYPYLLFSSLFLAGELLFWTAGFWGALAALIIGLIALGSVILELLFRPNPFRWVLPTGTSHNAWASVPPRGPARQKVVLVGHIDSHRTPLVFSTPGWTQLFKTLVPLGLLSSVILLVLFATGLVSPSPVWQWISLPFSLVIAGVFFITLQADFTPYTKGANDNATGAALVLNAAERLAHTPLENTEVWAVLTGCEEVGCYGAEAFAARHKEELKGAAWIALDGLGSGRIAYLTQETFLFPARSDPALLAIAQEVAEQSPELDVFPYAFQGAYTDGFIGIKYGLPTLTLLGKAAQGELPEWHRLTDDMEHLDPQVLQKAEQFLWEILRAIDRKGLKETI